METCLWLYESDSDYYDTACGEAFTFTNERLEDSRFKFCPYCGKPITQQQLAASQARVQELSKPLTWTTDRPTVAGWYWWGFPGRGEEVVYIFMAGGKNRKKLYMSYLGLDEAPPLLDHVTGEWAGPIPLPQEGGGRI